MTSRLPVPGQDDGVWGSILNDYLSVEHNADGTLKRTSDIDTAKSTAQAAQQAATNAQTTANAAYIKSSAGIPKSDLTTAIQSSLDKADSALQMAPVTSVNGKSGSVTLKASDVGAADVFMVSEYTQANDSDDTPSIVRAVAAAQANGGGIVRGDSRKGVYIVSPQSSQTYIVPSGASSILQVCVAIPDGVTVDMQGAIVKLTGSVSAAVFCNSNTTISGTRNSDIGLRNVIVDGNNLVPTAGLVFFAYISRLVIDSLRVTNCQYVGFGAFNIDHATFGLLDADTITGQAFALGTPSGSNNQIYDSTFGTLRARNILQYNTGSQPGNSVAGVLTRCTISRIEARDCAAGVKLQGPGSDVAVGTVFSYNTGLASGNSGLKLQGDSVNGWYPVRHSVSNVISINSGGQGLFMELAIDCVVGAYVGKNNNSLGNTSDVWIGGTRDNVHSIKSEGSGSAGVIIRTYATDYTLGSVVVRNAGQLAGSGVGLDIPGGRGMIDNLVVIDDQSTPTMSKGFRVTSAAAVLDIKKRRISGPATAYTIATGAAVNLNDPSPLPYLGGVRSGFYALLGNTTNTSNTTVGSLRLYQVVIPVATSITRIGAEITVAGEAGSKLRLGIYADDGSGMPAALVLDAGQLDASIVGPQELVVSQALPIGIYWVGGVVQSVTTTPPTVRVISAPLLPQQIAATTIPTAGQVVVGVSIGSITGELPGTLAPSALNAGSVLRVFVKFA